MVLNQTENYVTENEYICRPKLIKQGVVLGDLDTFCYIGEMLRKKEEQMQT